MSKTLTGEKQKKGMIQQWIFYLNKSQSCSQLCIWLHVVQTRHLVVCLKTVLPFLLKHTSTGVTICTFFCVSNLRYRGMMGKWAAVLNLWIWNSGLKTTHQRRESDLWSTSSRVGHNKSSLFSNHDFFFPGYSCISNDLKII